MTKKHFEAAARIVRLDMAGNPEGERRLVARYYVRLFVQFSAAFDRARFFKACGLEEELR